MAASQTDRGLNTTRLDRRLNADKITIIYTRINIRKAVSDS